MSNRRNVLVAIMNDELDFKIARDQNWYRIPVSSVEKWLMKCWPPKWIAFYQTKTFDKKAHSVNYFAKITVIRKAYRWQILPDRPDSEKRNKQYYQLFFEPLKPLPKPIYSRRWRRIVFIPTTWKKFKNAEEINDLYDGSSLEDKLWVELKRLKIQAERQEYVDVDDEGYFLDFAIYCKKGKIDIETDGDKWHHNPKVAPKDNIRNNALESEGWSILRFTEHQVNKEMSSYCIPKIVRKVKDLGFVDEDKHYIRRIDSKLPGTTFQYDLFDMPDEDM